MVVGEFVLEGRLKDIAAKAAVLAIETLRNASCYGWEMAIPAPPVARIRGGSGPLATPCTVPRGSHRIEMETPPYPVPAVRTVHLDGGTDAPEEYKVSKHPPKNKQETIREALLIFSVAVQSVAVASRMIACTCTKTIEIEPKLGHFYLRYC
jgi:hypothetical protein